MGILIGADWIIKALGLIFISFLDRVAYSLLYMSYTIFMACSDLNLFGGTVEAALNLYEGFTQRIYSILSIVMVFVFAYQLILMIINPDGDGTKASSRLVKDTIISLVAIAILPTVFKYMTLFQHHVVADNTIIKLVIGDSGSQEDPGKSLTMIVFMSMYHPVGSTYGTFMNNDGTLKSQSDAVSACEAGGATTTVCEEWYDGMEEWNSSKDASIKYVGNREKLRDVLNDDEGTEYNFILSTACAILVAWFIFSYALEMGTRAVKLGFLEIISPIPLILKVFPQTKKTFDTWKKEMIKTYLDVFFRLFVIAFIIQLCIMVPDFIEVIFSGKEVASDNPLVVCIATVVLILGLLNFAKQAPELVKEMLNNGGIMNGLDFKPGVKKRITDNEYAMKGASTAIGGAGGAIGNFARRYNERRGQQNDDKRGVAAWGNIASAAAYAVRGVPRGMVAGGKNGFKNSMDDLSISDTIQQFNQGVSTGQKEGVRVENLKREAPTKAPFENSNNIFGKAINKAVTETERTIVASNLAQDAIGHWNELKNTKENIKGVNSDVSDQTLELYKVFQELGNMSLENMKKQTEFIDKAIEDMKKKIAKGESVEIIPPGANAPVKLDLSDSNVYSTLKKYGDEQRKAFLSDYLNTNDEKRKTAEQSISKIAKLLETNQGSVRPEAIKKIAEHLGKSGSFGVDPKDATLSDITNYLKDISKDGNTATASQKINAIELSKVAGDLITEVQNARKSDELLAAGGKKPTGKSDKKDGK